MKNKSSILNSIRIINQTKCIWTFMLSILLLMSFYGCYSYKGITNKGTSYVYDYAMLNKDSTTAKVDTVMSTSGVLSFNDEKINIDFTIGLKSISFVLKNKTNNVMKIIWDETSIVQYGKTHKVMHSGVKYNDRNSSQPPTAIPPLASIDDLVLPTDNVHYREGYYSTYSSSPGGWEEYDLFPQNDFGIKDAIMIMKGKTFSVYLPIQYQGKTLDYTFNFVIKNVRVWNPHE